MMWRNGQVVTTSNVATVRTDAPARSKPGRIGLFPTLSLLALSLSHTLFFAAAAAPTAGRRTLLRRAMVSWNDGETSDDSIVNLSSSCDGIIKLPATMHDPDFSGTDADMSAVCEHGKPAERFVAFEGMHTGRRFLGCGEKEGINCGVVQWVDFEWPDSMEKALAKLWDMYDESKAARTNDNLQSSFTIHNLAEEKKKLQENYDNLYADVNALLDSQQQRAMEIDHQQQQKENVDQQGNLKAEVSKKEEENKKLQQKYDTLKNLAAAQANVIRNLKCNHLKEKEKLTEERHKLQYHIAELQKSEEKIKLKLQGVKAILDE